MCCLGKSMVFDDKKLDLAYEMGLPFLNVSVVNVICEWPNPLPA